jgi:hypothetical protein
MNLQLRKSIMSNPSYSAASFKSTDTPPFVAILRECLMATPLGVLSQALKRSKVAGTR